MPFAFFPFHNLVYLRHPPLKQGSTVNPHGNGNSVFIEAKGNCEEGSMGMLLAETNPCLANLSLHSSSAILEKLTVDVSFYSNFSNLKEFVTQLMKAM